MTNLDVALAPVVPAARVHIAVAAAVVQQQAPHTLHLSANLPPPPRVRVCGRFCFRRLEGLAVIAQLLARTLGELRCRAVPYHRDLDRQVDLEMSDRASSLRPAL